MPTERKQPINAGELLDDIRYINQASKTEIKAIGNRLRERIVDASLPNTVTDSLINEISDQLGRLATRVNLVEGTIKSLQSDRKPTTAVVNIPTEITHSNQSNDLRFTASQLAGSRNLLPMESSKEGVVYRWTGANPDITFSFPLDRSKALGMRVRLFALIKPEFSKQLRVLVDGHHVKHSFGLDGSLFVVNCVLPPSDKKTTTEVKIVLPATYSPMELGSSHDGRKMGVAINEIHFGQPESGLTRLLKRLRFKR